MTPFHSLRRPIDAAPMAGCVSTPRLVRAAANAGGIGFLASGYASLSKVEAKTRESGVTVRDQHLPANRRTGRLGCDSPISGAVGARDRRCPARPAGVRRRWLGVQTRPRYRVACPDGQLYVRLPEAVARLVDAVKLPVIAAGGIATPGQVRAALAAGAIAAQVDTALLRTPESGARPVHKAALVDLRFTETVVTRAFTGRAARALRNGFVDRFDRDAPSGYPYVHHLTKSLRDLAAARGDADGMSLWAGRQHALAQDRPAAEVIATLAAELP